MELWLQTKEFLQDCRHSKEKEIYQWSCKQNKEYRPAPWVRTEVLPLPTSIPLQNVSSSPCSSEPLDCNCHTWGCLTALTWPDPKCRRTEADKETSGCHSWIHQAAVHPKVVCATKWHHVLSPIERGLICRGWDQQIQYQQGIYELIIVFPFLQQGSNLFLQHLHFSTQHLVPGSWGVKFFFQFLMAFLESIVLPGEFLQKEMRIITHHQAPGAVVSKKNHTLPGRTFKMVLEYCIIPKEVEIIKCYLLPACQHSKGVCLLRNPGGLGWFWILILHYSVQMEQPRALQIQEVWGDVCIWDEEGQGARGRLQSLGAAVAGLGCEVGQSFLQQTRWACGMVLGRV